MTKSKDNYLRLAKTYSALILLLLLVIFNSIFTPNFFRLNNLNNTITQICPTVLCGMGMTLVISTGGIDISVGSMMAVSGVLTTLLMTRIGILPAVLLSILLTAVVGCMTGFMVGGLRLQAMVITLGLMLLLRGAAQVLCGGRDIYFNKLGDTGAKMSLWGTHKLGGVLPVQIVPILLAILIVYVLVSHTVLGRQIQAVGDNLRSSRLAGIRTTATLMFVYGLSGLMAGLAGVFQAAKVSVAAGSSLGQLAELDAIAAVVIGGTPMSGGKAHVFGTVIGVLIMQMITMTCIMNDIPEQYARVFKAAMIIFAVFIQQERAK